LKILRRCKCFPLYRHQVAPIRDRERGQTAKASPQHKGAKNMDAYCAGCGTEVDNLELLECVICGQLFCEACLLDGDICGECLEAEEEYTEDEEDDTDF
jgi:hypothetical protein